MTTTKDARLVGIGQRLKAFRKSHGYKSQESFALDIGSTRAAIASYELGRVEPTGAFLHNLSVKFGADINYILTGKSEQDTPDIDAYLIRMGVDEMAKTIIKSYMALPPDKRKIVKDYIDSLANAIVSNKKKHSAASSDAAPSISAPVDPSPTQSSPTEIVAEDPAIEEEVSKIRARLYAQEKTRRILTGSTSSVPFGGNKKPHK